MKKTLYRIYVTAFIVCLAIPFLVYLFVAKHLDLENHENHVLVSGEDVIRAPWYEKTIVLENYINDHLPYKNELTKLNTLVDINIFRSLDSDSVMLGKDNWLFYKLDKCIEDYRGSLGVSQEETDALISAMQNMQAYCNEKGIELVYQITPNKETIYGDLYMPEYIDVVSNSSRADILLKNIMEQTDISIVYAEEELKYWRDKGYQTYRKYDTHWNQVGGFIGTDSLLQELGKQTETLEDVSIVTNGTITGDLANMIAMGSVLNDDCNYEIEDYKSEIYVELIEERQEPNLNYSHYRSTVDTGEVIMCIGDSFLGAMEPYISKNYAESYFLHIANYQAGMIETVKPDVIVISQTERAFPGLYWSLNALLESK